MARDGELVRAAVSMALAAAFMVLAAAFLACTTHAVLVEEQGGGGCGGARDGELAVMLGERGGVPGQLGERDDLAVILGERGGVPRLLREQGDVPLMLGERGVVPGLLGERGGVPLLLEAVGDDIEDDPSVLFMQVECSSWPNGEGMEELQPTFDLLDVPYPMPSMQWVLELQPIFDQWMDGMEDQVVVGDEQDNLMVDGEEEIVANIMVDDGEYIVGADEIVANVMLDGGEEIVANEMPAPSTPGVEQVHSFDVLTAGEQVIFDIMFMIHHPNICHEDGSFSRDDYTYYGHCRMNYELDLVM